MRDHTRLPSYREIQAKKAQEYAIRAAYADRSNWRPRPQDVEADKSGGQVASTERNKNWIEWKGDDCPVHEKTRVDVQFADGEERHYVRAGDFYWKPLGERFSIVAYRVYL